MLDAISGGRLILGIGRGAGQGRVRRLPPADGRVARALRRVRRDAPARASRPATVEYDGTYVKQPRAAIRPRAVQVVPRPHLRGGGLAGVGADHGRARRRHPDHPAEAVGRGGQGARRLPDASTARSTAPRRRRRSAPAGPSATRTPSGRASMARRYIGGYYETVLDHYQLRGRSPRHDEGLRVLRQDGGQDRARTATDAVIDFFVDLQVWGTPEQCYEKILDIRRRVGNEHFVGVFSYAGHAVRRGRAQHAPLRRRGHARAAEARGDGAGTAGAGRRRYARTRSPRAGLLTVAFETIRYEVAERRRPRSPSTGRTGSTRSTPR